jgi:hypothetical protein
VEHFPSICPLIDFSFEAIGGFIMRIYVKIMPLMATLNCISIDFLPPTTHGDRESL